MTLRTYTDHSRQPLTVKLTASTTLGEDHKYGVHVSSRYSGVSRLGMSLDEAVTLYQSLKQQVKAGVTLIDITL